MFTRRFQCHDKSFQKNPFLGECFRVFLAADPDDDLLREDAVETYLAPNIQRAKARESAMIEMVKEWIPSQQIYNEKVGAGPMEERWAFLRGAHNGILSYSEWVLELKENIRKLSRDDPKWKEKLKNVHKGLDTLYNFQETDLKGVALPGMVISKESLADAKSKDLGEFEAARDDLLRTLSDVQVGLKNAEKESEKLIKREMKADFETRLIWLKGAWKDNAPDHLKDNKKAIDQEIRLIETTLNMVQKAPENYTGDFKEYQAIWRDLDLLESAYTENMTIQEYKAKVQEDTKAPLSFESLEEKAERLKKLREKVIKEKASRYETALRETTERLKAFRVTVAALSAEDDEKREIKEEKLKAIDKQLEKLGKSVNLEKISHDALFSEENLYEKNESPAQEVIQRLILKKGLVHQIQQIKDAEDLSPAEREVLMVYLDQALNRYEKLLNEDYFKPLEAIDKNITESISKLSSPEAQGGAWSWNLIAITDFAQAFTIINDWATRKLARNSKYRMGKAGSQTLKVLNDSPFPFRFLRTLSNEFDRVKESSETEEVNAIKSGYDNKDLFDVERIAYSTGNPDEFKACLQLLAAGGRLRWDSIPLLKQLNKFQSTVSFELKLSKNLSNISEFYAKLAKAMGELWDYDTFAALKTQNESAYNSKKGEFEPSCAAWAQEDGGLPLVIGGFLNEYKLAKSEGRIPNFNPIAYEKIIDYAIAQGLMAHEDIMYYLIQGIAWGILSFDRGAVLNTAYSNQIPSIEWFSSVIPETGKKPVLRDIEKLAALDKVAFTHYFHFKIMNLPRVFQRANKALSQGLRLDHDALTSTLAYINVEPTRTMLKVQGDGFKLPSTGLHNWSVSEMHYLDQFAFDADNLYGDSRALKERIGRFVGTVVMKRGILDNRIFTRETHYYRYSNDDYNSEPRSNGAYKKLYGRDTGTKKLETVRDYNKQIQDYLLFLDEDFFAFLQDKTKTKAEVPALLKILRDRYGVTDYKELFGGNEVSDVDDLHKYTSDFMSFLIDHEGQFNKVHAMVDKIREDQAPLHAELRRHLQEQEGLVTSGASIREMRKLRDREDAELE